MTENQFQLLSVKRFLPLFATQFLGAMNDNLFKQALVILITFRLAQQIGMDAAIIVTIAGGLFILPFFLFSATAGQIADRFEKSASIRIIKIAEILIMGLAAAGFYYEEPYHLLGVLFLMGTQSAFFGPLKYSILPNHLREDELITGNAFIESGTFLAILIGTIAGGLIILTEDGIRMISIAMVGFAILGWVTSLFIPAASAAAPDLKISTNFVAQTWRMMKLAAEKRALYLSILGISWFWLLGATFLAQFPAYTRLLLGADETVVTLFMAVFSIGIGLGSLWCNKLLKGEVSARYVPFGALGLTIFTLDLFFASPAALAAGTSLIGVGAFLETPANWRILMDLLGIAVSGGIYSVPLYAILQHDSDDDSRSRIIAANNIVNALFIVAGALAAAALLAAGWSIPELYLGMAILNLFVAFYIIKLVPEGVIKAFLAGLLKLLYRVEVRGLEHYAKAGKRAVIVVNHVSFLDALLLGAFLPKKFTFAINTQIANQWWIKPFLTLTEAFPIDPTNPMATKSLIKLVQEDRHCVIFPEGRITVTGALMKIYEGPGMIADKADAMLVPIRIDGAQFTPFSRLKGKLRQRWFPKITVTILEPRKFDIPEDVVGRARRQMAGVKLYDVMTDMIFETCDYKMTLFEALVEARDQHGGKHPIIEDIERTPLSYDRVILGSHVLGRKLCGFTDAGERVGVLLPNSAGGAVTFFALQCYGRVPAMLNFSTGAKNMVAAIKAAEIKTVLTSKRFVDLGNLEDTVKELSEHAEIVYLEDIRPQITLLDKLAGLLAKLWPARAVRKSGAKSADPAVVLFTSGSEGTPKGVVLSHENLLANRFQLTARVDFNSADVVFNALPIFHSFGMTGGMLLPVLSGVKTYLYPSPLHYRIVPALVYDTNATIMFGTDTFLNGYARVAHPYDFYSIRYIFAGAERVKDETRKTFADKFGLRILEGYGATETAPVLSANTPMHFRAGTVGRLLPGIDFKLEEVPGIDDGGKLIVRGPNIMLGYLRAEKPGVLEPPEDGFYDTGDIVDVDEHGYVTIKGRAKRFAKVGGEMVFLTAVEGYAAALWPEHMHAAVSIPDDRKGEQVILLSDNPDADRSALLGYAKSKGVAEIMIPKTVQIVDAIPVLGTGKVDYVGVAELAKDG